MQFAIEDVNDLYEPYRIKKSLNKERLPQPIFEKNSELINFYYKAWELAYSHILYREDVPQPLYIDEAMRPDRIWIWDTSFMALFCRYASDQFPGIESLNNFYFIMHDEEWKNKKVPFKIHHLDNPPLFAWVEWEYFKLTGDLDRLDWIINKKEFLQKHFHFIEKAKRNKLYRYAGVSIRASKKKYGFMWSGTASGMDNSPRSRGRYKKILWLDLLAQQALSAKYMIKMAEVLKRADLIKEYSAYYKDYKSILNKYYWNEKEGFYFDIKKRKPTQQIKVKTPAAFWPMLAGITDEHKNNLMVEHLLNDKELGGIVPWPSVSRDDPEFDPLGQYWRGGVWLPTAYMGTKALEAGGKRKVANQLAERLLNFMLKTYQDFEPHTIWEVYSPTEYKPSTYKKNSRYCRPDFCGWSALGPISIFIENVLGFYEINAYENYLKWDLHQKCKHGIKNLKIGDNIVDIIYDDIKKEIIVNTNKPFLLIINEKKFEINQNNFVIDWQ